MKSKQNVSLNLSLQEKQRLRSKKVAQKALLTLAIDEIETLLEVSWDRAQEIHALAAFQTVPTIGIKFAEDLIFLGYYSLEALADKDAAELLNAFEAKKGYWTDPCVEDQFRLVVHYAKHQDSTKKWWDFTAERKKYRQEVGYPLTRPKMPWHEVPEA